MHREKERREEKRREDAKTNDEGDGRRRRKRQKYQPSAPSRGQSRENEQREKSHRKNCPQEERSGGEDFVVIARCFNVRRVKIVDKRFVTNEIRRKPQDEPEKSRHQAVRRRRRSLVRVFRGEESSACFAFANHPEEKTTKRHSFGRFYNHKIYDCVEMMINGESFMSINNFGSVASSTTIGSKPCMMFLGDKSRRTLYLKQLKNVFTTYFGGRVVTRINLKGIDRAIVVTALEDGKTILFRQFAIKYKKSGTRLPKVHLEEIIPRPTHHRESETTSARRGRSHARG